MITKTVIVRIVRKLCFPGKSCISPVLGIRKALQWRWWMAYNAYNMTTLYTSLIEAAYSCYLTRMIGLFERHTRRAYASSRPNERINLTIYFIAHYLNCWFKVFRPSIYLAFNKFFNVGLFSYYRFRYKFFVDIVKVSVHSF